MGKKGVVGEALTLLFRRRCRGRGGLSDALALVFAFVAVGTGRGSTASTQTIKRNKYSTAETGST